MLRKLLVLALLLALGLILVPRLFKRYPAQAVVNAPVMEMRSPVEAIVLEVTAMASGQFETAPRNVVTLKTRIADELAALREQERMLSTRATNFVQDEKKRLQIELLVREGELKRVALELASEERELGRQTRLLDQGFISTAQLDATRIRSESALVQREIAKANIARAQANLSAMTKNGFLGERAGGADVSYTQQKLDEIRLRISQLAFWTGSMKAGHAGAPLPQPAIQTPGMGMLLGPFVTAGAFLAPGDLIAHYVMCGQSFVDLRVPVTDLKDYQIGESVSFRVAGEWDFYKGQISQIHPVYLTHQKNALAVKSDEVDLTGIARVWVRPEVAFAKRINREPNCMMGQQVHAQLPHGANWFRRSTSFLADVF
jgi:multidrug resistance efflux pump